MILDVKKSELDKDYVMLIEPRISSSCKNCEFKANDAACVIINT